MKRFLQLKMVILTIVVFGLANIVVADINITGYGNASIKSPVFEQANSPSGNMLSFDYNQSDGDGSSLGTCTMNPMGSASNDAVLEEFPIIEPETYTPVTNRASTLASTASTLDSETGNTDLPYLPPRLDPPPTEPVPPATPEPATLLMMGFGIVGLAPLVRRYRQK